MLIHSVRPNRWPGLLGLLGCFGLGHLFLNATGQVIAEPLAERSRIASSSSPFADIGNLPPIGWPVVSQWLDV